MTIEQLVKWAIGIIGAVLGNYIRKNAIPVSNQLKITYKLSSRVDLNEKNAAITQSTFDAIFKISYDPIFIVDLEGNMIYGNPAWGTYTGFDNISDAYGKNFMVLIPDGRETERIEKISERIVEHPSAWEGEVNMIHLKSGAKLLSRCRTDVIIDDKKKPVHILGRLQILKPTI